jgi:hypothetical protein
MTAEVQERSAADDGGPGPSLEERDFYSRTLHQAETLRSGRTAGLDLLNLAEEIGDWGHERSSKPESALCLILLHMSKRDPQATRRSRSWVLSIQRQRLEYQDIIGSNPRLKPRREEAVLSAYRKARLEAAEETGLPLSAFPPECPYSLEDTLERPFDWPES